jgi:hypothetical protein
VPLSEIRRARDADLIPERRGCAPEKTATVRCEGAAYGLVLLGKMQFDFLDRQRSDGRRRQLLQKKQLRVHGGKKLNNPKLDTSRSEGGAKGLCSYW